MVISINDRTSNNNLKLHRFIALFISVQCLYMNHLYLHEYVLAGRGASTSSLDAARSLYSCTGGTSHRLPAKHGVIEDLVQVITAVSGTEHDASLNYLIVFQMR